MKKVLLMTALLLAATPGWCDYIPEYHGSFETQSGQTLYYVINYETDIINGYPVPRAVSVSIVAPVRYEGYINGHFATGVYPCWEGYVKPQGVLTIPDSVYTQSENALLPVKSIASGAFYECDALTSVTIPSTIIGIGERAFYNCLLLDSLIIQASDAPSIGLEEKEINSITYQVLPFPATNIVIPCGSYESYANTWQFSDQYYAIRTDNGLEYWYYWAPRLVFEESPDITLNVNVSDTTQGDAGVLLNGCWFYSWSHPQSASCVDSTVIVGAFPRDGFRFDHWSNESTANPDTLHLSSDLILTAYFVAEGDQTYSITVTSADQSMGTVTGGGTYNDGATATLIATANNGYRFDHWQDNNTQNPRTITVTGNATFTAYFVATQGIEGGVEDGVRFYVIRGRIIVEGTADEVRVFDMVGHSVRNEALPAGVYMVKIGERPAQKVVVPQ